MNSPDDTTVVINPHYNPDRRPELDARSVAFVHLQKCGGGTFATLNSAFCARFGFTHVWMSGAARFPHDCGELYNSVFEAERRNFMFGHAPLHVEARAYGAIDAVTILRDPIERLVSECLFMNLSSHNVATTIDELIDVVGQRIRRNADELLKGPVLVKNYMTRTILGNVDRNEPLSGSHVDAAIANVANDFTLVGTLDEYEKFVRAYLVRYNFPSVAFPRIHSQGSAERQFEYRLRYDELCKLFEEFVDADLELYQKVKETEADRLNEAIWSDLSEFSLSANAPILAVNERSKTRAGKLLGQPVELPPESSASVVLDFDHAA
ncbi:MAG: hypothetical protein ABJ215_00680 [Alphaproteobacteria bacterium]